MKKPTPKSNSLFHYILILGIAFALAYIFLRHSPPHETNDAAESLAKPEHLVSDGRGPPSANDARISKEDFLKKPPSVSTENSTPRPAPVLQNLPKERDSRKEKNPGVLSFVVQEDGLATTDGDIVLGITQSEGINEGQAKAPDLQLWPQGDVPYHIQGNFDRPDRVLRALSLFANTPVQLHPQNGEGDMIVFESAASGCKSYLGRVGGKQPIWIGPECGPSEIAHEILHALGFVHEQNRADRDAYVRIVWDQVMDAHKINFEIFPQSLMTVSGQAAFDYDSLMIYAPNFFAKNPNANTLESLDKTRRIQPSTELSAADRLRLERIYGRQQ